MKGVVMAMADSKSETICPAESCVASERRHLGIVVDLGAMSLLAVVSLLAGCVINILRAHPLPWFYQDRAQTLAAAVAQVTTASPPVVADDPVELPHEIRLEEFQTFVAEHKGLVLDARPAAFYRAAHVPGAISLPREVFADQYPRVLATLESFKARPIAIYCSGADCPDSQLLTDALTKLGYRHLLIYTSGWDEWSQTGLPQEGASPQS